MSTAPSPAPAPSTLSDAQYREVSGAALAHVESTVDRWLDEDVVDIDSSRTGGLLELTFPNRSKIVINTQPPLHEIWLAALSGGYHYKFSEGRWRDTRDGTEFFEALSRCASEQAGRALSFGLPASR